MLGKHFDPMNDSVCIKVLGVTLTENRCFWRKEEELCHIYPSSREMHCEQRKGNEKVA